MQTGGHRVSALPRCIVDSLSKIISLILDDPSYQRLHLELFFVLLFLFCLENLTISENSNNDKKTDTISECMSDLYNNLE